MIFIEGFEGKNISHHLKCVMAGLDFVQWNRYIVTDCFMLTVATCSRAQYLHKVRLYRKVEPVFMMFMQYTHCRLL